MNVFILGRRVWGGGVWGGALEGILSTGVPLSPSNPENVEDKIMPAFFSLSCFRDPVSYSAVPFVVTRRLTVLQFWGRT